MTCAKRPGSLGHEYQDALQYAAWGVDYLKYDWCNTTTQDAQAAYAIIRNALNATGRPIVLSICEWGTAKPWLWGAKVGGNLWRTTGDISDCGNAKDKHGLGVCTSSICRMDWRVMPDRATGTILTCWRSATAV